MTVRLIRVLIVSIKIMMIRNVQSSHIFPEATDMREHVLLFCLLGLVLTATIILVTAPGAVTWALALID